MTFGMSVVLSLWAPTTSFLWRYFLAHMLLSFLAPAAAASFLAGLLLLPSLATEAAMQAVITALRKTGQTGTLCVSILLRPQQQQGGLLPGATRSLEQHLQWQQQQQLAATSTSNASTAGSMTARNAFSDAAGTAFDRNSATHSSAFAASAPALATNASPTSTGARGIIMQQTPQQQQQQQQHDVLAGLPTAPSPQLQQQPSLLEEEPEFASHPFAELDRMVALTQPGHWGLRSFVVAAASSSSQTSQQQQQEKQKGQGPGATGPDAAAAAAAIAAAATVPGEEEHAASEAAADEELDEAVLQDDVHEDANDLRSDSSWWDQHKPQLLQRLHLPLPHQRYHQQQHSKSHNHLQHASSTYSTNHHGSSHKQQQQQHVWAQQQAARHLFMRLGRGIDHIRPLLAEARMLREAVVVEQASWLRLLTAGPAWQPWGGDEAAGAGGCGAAGVLPVGAWGRLVEALGALLER
jgi:hypothetical protein